MTHKTSAARALSAGLLTLALVACSAGGGGGGGSSAGGSGGSGGSNLKPVAASDTAVVVMSSSNNKLAVLANDSDANGDALSIAAASISSTVPSGQAGTVQVQSDGLALRFTPPAGFLGTQTIQYTISDGHGGSASSFVLVTVSPIALPPAAVPDVFNVVVDSSANSLDVLANDIDGAGGGLTLSSVAIAGTVPPGSSGSVSVANNQLVYTPAAGFVGAEAVQYVITDANGATATTTAVITVSPVTVPPVAVPDVFPVAPTASAVALDVLANDIDLGGAGLTLASVTPLATVPSAGAGSFAILNNQVIYTPPSGFIGIETAQYTVTGAGGLSATGLMTIVVAVDAAAPPLAVADAATIAADSSGNSIAVLANDIDASGTGLTVTAVSELASLPPASGASVSTDGTTVSYTPPAGYSGVVTLQYTITDGNGNTSTAPVLITVSALALPPIAIADLATVAEDGAATTLDVLVNDLDVSATGLSITAVTPITTLPPGFTGTISTDGSTVSYQPAAGFAGVETFSYDIVDGNGGSSTGVVTVTVTPAALVIPPVPVPDLANVLQDSSNNLVDVLANDLSPSGAALTLTAVSVVTSLPTATHTVGISGNQVEFTPAAGFAGAVTLSYTVSDGTSSATGAAVISVTPTALTPSPVALPDVVLVSSSSGAISVDVLANDIDPAGGGLTLTAASIALELPPGSGSVSIAGNQVQYTPTLGYLGSVTVSYTAQDSLGRTTDGQLVMTVTP